MAKPERMLGRLRRGPLACIVPNCNWVQLWQIWVHAEL